MINKTIYQIFHKGSRTMFYSSLFFPKKIRQDVFICYAFVRRADNLVDSLPAKPQEFYRFKQHYHQATQGKPTGDIVIDSFADLEQRKQFDPHWTESFLHSMELDLTKTSYETVPELLNYVYGAAEVMGLYMSNILNLPKEAYPAARYLGRAFQCINALRDINEDNHLGRSYIPLEDLHQFGLHNLTYDHAKQYPNQFTQLIHTHLTRFYYWLHTAEQGYHFLPKRYLISVKTAMDMYQWTAEQIHRNPFIVYDWKVKPLISQIIGSVFLNLIDPIATQKRQNTFNYEPTAIPQIIKTL